MNSKSSQDFRFGEAQLLASLPEIRSIVDIGANDGAWAALATRLHPNAKYLGVEADRGVCQQARSRVPLGRFISGVMVGTENLSEFSPGKISLEENISIRLRIRSKFSKW